MFDILDNLLKELQKASQKSSVRAIGLAMSQQVSDKKTKGKSQHKTTISDAKKSLSQTNAQLQGVVKGQFAKKIIKTFDKQKKELDSF